MKTRTDKTAAAYIRNFIFGVEDSLVSTVGLLSGIAIADVPRATIFLTGLVLIFVEAVSMAAGSFLSEYSAEEFENKKEVPPGEAIANGAIMFFSYFVSGFVPLLPYILFDVATAFWVSIVLALAALFVLGVIGAHLSHVKVLRYGMRMLIVSGLAIVVGIAVGKIADGI